MRTSKLRQSLGKAQKTAISLLCSLTMVATLTPGLAFAASAAKESGITVDCIAQESSVPSGDITAIDIVLKGQTGNPVPASAQLTINLAGATVASVSSEAPNAKYASNEEGTSVTVSYLGLEESGNAINFSNGSYEAATIYVKAGAQGQASASVDATASVVGFVGDISDYSIISGSAAEITVTAAQKTVERLWGSNSMTTAANIAAETYESADVAIVATATSYYDALAASPFAGLMNAPILLVYSDDSYNDPAYEAIETLGVKTVYIAGGTSAVSSEIESKLSSEYGCDVYRVDGSSLEGYQGYAIDTALDFAQRTLDITASNNAILVTQRSFMDALSMSSYAYSTGTPIIMIDWDLTLGDRAKAILDNVDGTIYVAGGTAAVPEAAAEAFYSGKIVRLAGDTGYDTSLAIARYLVENDMATPETICVAAGTSSLNGVDALAGAALAGVNRGVILLASWDTGAFDYYSAIDDFMNAYTDNVNTAYILGGPSALLSDYYNHVADFMGCDYETL